MENFFSSIQNKLIFSNNYTDKTKLIILPVWNPHIVEKEFLS